MRGLTHRLADARPTDGTECRPYLAPSLFGAVIFIATK